MPKEMFISSSPHETKVAVLEDEQLVEVYFERDTDVGLVGGIYKGRVNRVLPGMQSAFVNIGLDKDAFLYVSDFFLEDQEEFDNLLEETETRVTAVATENSFGQVREGRVSSSAGAGESAISQLEEAPGPTPAEVAEPAAPATAGENVLPLSSEEATLPVPASSHDGRTSANSVPPATTPEARHEFRRHEHRGRRRRGRRGGYGEGRFAPRSEPPRLSEPGGPHTFEILPGESLAKYQQERSEASAGATEMPSPAEPSASAEASAESVDETRHDFSIAEGPNSVHEPAANEGEQTPMSRRGPSASEEKISAPAPAALRSEREVPSEPRAESSVNPRADASESTASSNVEDVHLSPSQTHFPPQEQPKSEGSGEEVMGVLEPASLAGDEAGTSSPSAPPSSEPTEGTPARDYTLREPQTHPRFAPRRGRRGRRRGGHQSRPVGTPAKVARSGNLQPMKIADLLKEGQEILVQIAKEPLGTKGARITSHIALPGRYLVYMPTISHIGISRRISSEQERLRLRNIILEHRGSLTGGLIVRTAGEGRSEEEFKADLKFLTTLWNDIRAKAEQAKAPALIYRDLDLVQRMLRDILTPAFKSIRVDSEVVYERVVDFVSRCQPSLVGQVKLHSRPTPLFEQYSLQTEIEKALRPKVWLKSGGYIVINQTEALVAIDVNTGKYVGKTSRLEDTILKTNIDAVNEIVRQVRLRDLGGIIVIDFIDMDERRNRNKVIQTLDEALRRDRAPTKLLSFNDFGLVAITRKRVKQSLERTLCEPCPYCNSSGWVKSVATVSNEILSEAQKMAHQLEGRILNIRVNPEVAHALRARGGALVSELESLTHKEVVIVSDPAVHQERYEIF